MSSSENQSKVSNVTQKPKSVPLSRTNKSSLQPHHQQKIVDYILKYKGTVGFLQYLMQCGCFGPLGSDLRSKAVSRRKYLEKLRNKSSTREFVAILDSLKPTSSDSGSNLSSSTPELSSSPPSLRIRPTAQSPVVELLPPKARSPSKPVLPAPVTSSEPIVQNIAPKKDLEYNMDHLAPQVKAAVTLDFDHPEKNEGLWPFKNTQIVYCGERISLYSFVLPVVDPRDLMKVTVTLLDDCKGFKVRQNIVHDSLVGEHEKVKFIEKKVKKQGKKLMDCDNCNKDKADGLIASTAMAFVVFCNSMQENTSTRFSERTYKFPDGVKARTNFFGNSNSNVKVFYNANQFEFSPKGDMKSYAAAAEWFIALDLKVEKLSNPRKKDKWEELDDALRDRDDDEGESEG